MISVFQKNDKSPSTKKLFLDEPVDVARYDNPKYPFLWKLTERQLSYFWQPSEVSLTKDQRDFKDLSAHEQHIFTSNLKRQIILDSVQGRSPSLAFLPIVSNSELEVWIQTWAFSETIHSQSYTHIIRNVYADPSAIFDGIMDIQEIVDCAKDISECYDTLIGMTHDEHYFIASENRHSMEKKKAIWLALCSVNILEGIRFYASFACSWSFAENKKMEGNAKIIKLICKDENLHLAGTQQLLKILPDDDPDFKNIAEETKDQVKAMYMSAVEQEKAWAKYIFKDGSIIGLNEQLLSEYIEYIAGKRMTAVGVEHSFNTKINPLPWTNAWIAGSDVQVAPQETEITSYQTGTVNMDVTEDTFKGFKL